MRLAGKVAIITGGASGIGQATALLFAKEGAKIVVADLNEASGHETVERIRHAGGEAVCFRADVTSAKNVEDLVQSTCKAFGKLDVLFTGAGIAMRLPVVDLPEEEWDRCIAINLKGIYLCCKYAIPELIKNGGGSIINVSSIYGIVGSKNRAAYLASKGGVANLTRGMALDYAADNIRANCICPGFTDTPLVRSIVKTQEEYQSLAEQHPIARLATPQDIAYGALYLASDEAAFVTGITLPIDGGYTAG